MGTYCNHCAPGYAESRFQPRDHSLYVATRCTACEAGYWNRETSGAACKACAAGFFQPNQRASSACASCPPGQSTSGLSGQSKCDLCASGMFTSVSGAPECSPCSEGKRQPDKNQSGCLACDAGQYQDSSSKSCLRYVYAIVSLHPHSLSSFFGSHAFFRIRDFSHHRCIPGQYQPDRNSSKCRVCEHGRYQPAVGQMDVNVTKGFEEWGKLSLLSVIWRDTAPLGSIQRVCVSGVSRRYVHSISW